jgi:CubicO group peptidase (beta-lactamase class C family)
MPSDSEIRQILVDRVDVKHRSVGIVVGVIGPEGRRVIAHGRLAKGDSRPLDGDTIFEIGSVTKVFTSLLLADMVQRGELDLDDPVAKYLPTSVKMPGRNGRPITLLHLSTHTSGLPRLPTNMAASVTHSRNPYASYSVERLYAFLSQHNLKRGAGSQQEYSNAGVGLLGHVLALRAGLDYEALVRSHICEPLGMNSTWITLTRDMRKRLARGHDIFLRPTENWDMPTLAGAGALRSDANDLLIFLAANLGYTESPLAPAMATMLKVPQSTERFGRELALGWNILPLNGREILWHNGGTGGYRSFVGFDPRGGVGVVVLSNAFTRAGVDDIGIHILDSRVPVRSFGGVAQWLRRKLLRV